MSLKAKLEAVIYAAEEPVTLAQLAGMFADEAIAWKAEQAAKSAAAEAEPAVPTIEEEFAYLDVAVAPEALAEAEAAAESTPEPETATDMVPSEATSTEAAVAPEETAPADAEADQKREARARDREVRGILRELIDELIASYAADERGIEIREIAGGYRVATKPECHDAVRQFIRSLKPPLKLSLPALETLAVVAYKQPVTSPEVSEIRGVESAGVLGSLLSRKLIATAGRKQVIGRPILYKTTREFLLRFGLKDVAELPSMEEFEKMAAIELDEQAPEDEAGAEPDGANLESGDLFDGAEDDSGDQAAQDGSAPEASTEPVPAHAGSGPAEPPQQAEIEASPHEE
jgi:segregation and condensation protein B